MFLVAPSLVVGACLIIQFLVSFYHLTEKRRAACVFVEMWFSMPLPNGDVGWSPA